MKNFEQLQKMRDDLFNNKESHTEYIAELSKDPMLYRDYEKLKIIHDKYFT